MCVCYIGRKSDRWEGGYDGREKHKGKKVTACGVSYRLCRASRKSECFFSETGSGIILGLVRVAMLDGHWRAFTRAAKTYAARFPYRFPNRQVTIPRGRLSLKETAFYNPRLTTFYNPRQVPKGQWYCPDCREKKRVFGCNGCMQNDRPSKILQCDGPKCGLEYHYGCLEPPLDKVCPA